MTQRMDPQKGGSRSFCAQATIRRITRRRTSNTGPGCSRKTSGTKLFFGSPVKLTNFRRAGAQSKLGWKIDLLVDYNLEQLFSGLGLTGLQPS